MGWFSKKKSGRHIATDEARELSIQTRKGNAEVKRMQQQLELSRLRQEQAIENKRLEIEKLQLDREIEDLRDEEIEDEPTETSDLVKMFAMQMFKGQQSPGMISPENMNTYTPPVKISLPDEALDQAIKRIPKTYFKLFKKVDDDTLNSILEYIRSCDDDTIKRFIQKAKSYK